MPYLDPHRFHFLLIDQFSGLRPILLYGSERKRFVPVNQNTPTRKAFQPILSRYDPTIPSRTYNLPAKFNDFSDIFNTSETQVSATVGLTMDYPKKEILSAKKNSSDVGSTKKNVQVNKPPSSPNLTFVVRKRLTLTPTTKSHPINFTAGINRSNTAVRAVLKQPCLTGGRTGTVRPKHLPAGRTGLSDQFLGPVAQDQPGPVGQICPTSWLSLRSDSVRLTTGRTRLFEHCSSSRVRPVNAGSAGPKDEFLVKSCGKAVKL
ncbi:hypothetical protein PCASD_03949 [Puccinia coronata f. sp. avenae]|uniref:Uncharacterized protein n=1 Tax=Puccinia coronata f. sp. avenae TaxID=200324 RepID=A0A2N5VAN1_9BASI|nr:hypothetical protein PCASD_24465 [Puccinia coronata f. sp. avenae]PLW47024.1 hypothetical protein PCASD_03949 [Puccinia coronata f. sp. avenae]